VKANLTFFIQNPIHTALHYAVKSERLMKISGCQDNRFLKEVDHWHHMKGKQKCPIAV
jgi:hypothetical protein